MKNPQSLVLCGFLMSFLAEREGFEPSLGYYPKHAFQACDLNRSSTSPLISADHCWFGRTRILAESSFTVPQRKIDGTHVLGQAAYRYAVYAGFGNGAHGFQEDASRSFELSSSGSEADGLTHLR